ncbi:CPBP family glutamic-type intramembrane protease [Treponema putidum]|uniref:CPBP family intramembrane metalloprotease n=2 Tax=Treponema putidum TaxID=221027 RepID=A0AAE9MS85_9SPIR|nr:CPBP family glutamic-type intramembrane protease [Treponema putidum]AIN94727.1 membrane protein [Treponema putidum]TWI77598.1 CAAX prenyl protease-like protein [Treponema putidum]UTY28747.1 CPBP family intramembrane metalloprotease [Treponema putidum]UTY31177.1 CPBP family intramembrane metalloprotease [Treponema putidum]UTY33614.1 CPBP family intramembrane metalloprotease [Treponema putidum]
MCFDKKSIRILLEFIFIFTVFVIPPMLNTRAFIPPNKPEGFFYSLIFISKIVFFAAYEEILYRIYLPYRIKSLYGQRAHTIKYCFWSSEIFPIIFFALAHRYLGFLNVLYAMAAGIIFRILYVLIQKKFGTKYSPARASITAAVCVIFIHSVHNCIIYLLIFKG